METVYIRSLSNHTLRDKLAPSCYACENSTTSLKPNDPSYVRSWHVDLSFAERPDEAREVHIDDPFTVYEYKSCFEAYLSYSEENDFRNHLFKDKRVRDDIKRLRAKIQEYARLLHDALNLELRPDTTCCHIYIITSDDQEQPANDIHCLAWELLESACPPNQPACKIRVTRITERGSAMNSLEGPAMQPLRPAPTRLARRRARFRVLLVVARNLQKDNPIDADPHFAQFPLMSIQKRLRGKLLLEVVRPGSLEELESHLTTRKKQGVRFHVVHFDLHGSLDSHGDEGETPSLQFTEHSQTSESGSSSRPGPRLAAASSVAKLLVDNGVENVVLNACLSAYNHTTAATNLSRLFIRSGIRRVSAMWFFVHGRTVSTYLGAFYETLLVESLDFHTAAHRGREALRLNKDARLGIHFDNSFLCVNYGQDLPFTPATPPLGLRRMSQMWTAGIGGQKPTGTPDRTKTLLSLACNPLARLLARRSPEQRHATPTTAVGGEAPQVPSSGCWPWPRDPPDDAYSFKLQLHHLDLEYKLKSFRVIYATDLGGTKPALDVTMECMIDMWLATNLIDEVFYYEGRDFVSPSAKPRDPRRRRRWLGLGCGMGYSDTPYEGEDDRQPTRRSASFARPHRIRGEPSNTVVSALNKQLHVVREIDSIINPGFSEDDNDRLQMRKESAREHLGQFASNIHGSNTGYILFMGSEEADWWKDNMNHLRGGVWECLPLHASPADRRIPNVWRPNEGRQQGAKKIYGRYPYLGF